MVTRIPKLSLICFGQLLKLATFAVIIDFREPPETNKNFAMSLSTYCKMFFAFFKEFCLILVLLLLSHPKSSRLVKGCRILEAHCYRTAQKCALKDYKIYRDPPIPVSHVRLGEIYLRPLISSTVHKLSLAYSYDIVWII